MKGETGLRAGKGNVRGTSSFSKSEGETSCSMQVVSSEGATHSAGAGMSSITVETDPGDISAPSAFSPCNCSFPMSQSKGQRRHSPGELNSEEEAAYERTLGAGETTQREEQGTAFSAERTAYAKES